MEQLIGGQSRYQGAFAGGTFTHLFLDVGDYHRYHFPLGGVVKEVAIIPGQEMAGGKVTWIPRTEDMRSILHRSAGNRSKRGVA